MASQMSVVFRITLRAFWEDCWALLQSFWVPGWYGIWGSLISYKVMPVLWVQNPYLENHCLKFSWPRQRRRDSGRWGVGEGVRAEWMYWFTQPNVNNEHGLVFYIVDVVFFNNNPKNYVALKLSILQMESPRLVKPKLFPMLFLIVIVRRGI